MINLEKGQSLFEVVVALGISALIIVALVSLVSNSIQNANFSKDKTLAANYAQEATEWLRQQRDSDPATFFGTDTVIQAVPICFDDLNWNNVLNGNIGNCPDGSSISNNTPFTREIIFNQDQSTVKTVIVADVTISWTDSQGQHIVTNSTSFSDWRQR